MTVHVVLNILIELGKKDKMRDLPSIISFFRYSFSLKNSIIQERQC